MSDQDNRPHPAVEELRLRKLRARKEAEHDLELPTFMQPLVGLRSTPEYLGRRQAIMDAMLPHARDNVGRHMSAAEWQQFVDSLIGPMPPEDKDAAGRPRNPEWWLHHALSTDAREIRLEGMRAIRKAGIPLKR
jgi:hypothetical protein